MGFDSFGLPAENAAIREGGHPREITERNIATIKRSMQRIGWAIDWSRELSTHEPEYYRWQQWLFLRFLERGLAYRKGAPVKWCPNDQTVLANEQVHDGRCERCGAEVESRDDGAVVLPHHRLRAGDCSTTWRRVDWPEPIKARQRNWIGRSEGAEIVFRIEELDVTCPSSRRGPTRSSARRSSSLAPEHELVARIDVGDEVREYVRRAGARRRPRSAPRPRRRPASSRACTRSTRSTASACPSTSPTTC